MNLYTNFERNRGWQLSCSCNRENRNSENSKEKPYSKLPGNWPERKFKTKMLAAPFLSSCLWTERHHSDFSIAVESAIIVPLSGLQMIFITAQIISARNAKTLPSPFRISDIWRGDRHRKQYIWSAICLSSVILLPSDNLLSSELR